MKSENPSSGRTSASRGKSNVGIPHLPMEWMDPMSWRLPSGKALAEFALQAGFLAPLMMRAPKGKNKPEPRRFCGLRARWTSRQPGIRLRRRRRVRHLSGKRNEHAGVDRGSGGPGGDDG